MIYRIVIVMFYVMLVSFVMSCQHVQKNYHKKVWFQILLFVVFFVSHIYLLIRYVMVG